MLLSELKLKKKYSSKFRTPWSTPRPPLASQPASLTKSSKISQKDWKDITWGLRTRKASKSCSRSSKWEKSSTICSCGWKCIPLTNEYLIIKEWGVARISCPSTTTVSLKTPSISPLSLSILSWPSSKNSAIKRNAQSAISNMHLLSLTSVRNLKAMILILTSLNYWNTLTFRPKTQRNSQKMRSFHWLYSTVLARTHRSSNCSSNGAMEIRTEKSPTLPSKSTTGIF